MKLAPEHLILGPSHIEGAGIGCFTLIDIPDDTRISVDENQKNRKLHEHEIPDSHLKYCPLLESGLYLAPANFAVMSVTWYINHAREPNIKQSRWQLNSARNIEAGEELFVYYPDLLTHPKNVSWVVPELHV